MATKGTKKKGGNPRKKGANVRSYQNSLQTIDAIFGDASRPVLGMNAQLSNETVRFLKTARSKAGRAAAMLAPSFGKK